jgi:hypothetical protein
MYDCLHEAEASRRQAKLAVRAVYEAQEGMDDESFVDASELVSILGRMMKRGLGGGGSGSGGSVAPTVQSPEREGVGGGGGGNGNGSVSGGGGKNGRGHRRGRSSVSSSGGGGRMATAPVSQQPTTWV